MTRAELDYTACDGHFARSLCYRVVRGVPISPARLGVFISHVQTSSSPRRAAAAVQLRARRGIQNFVSRTTIAFLSVMGRPVRNTRGDIYGAQRGERSLIAVDSGSWRRNNAAEMERSYYRSGLLMSKRPPFTTRPESSRDRALPFQGFPVSSFVAWDPR